MAELIKKYLPKASSRKGDGDLVAKSGRIADPDAGQGDPAEEATRRKPKPGPRRKPRSSEVEIAAVEPEPAPRPKKRPADPVPVVVEQAYAEPVPARFADIDPVKTASVAAPSGWAVQVASSPSEVEARAFLAKTGKRAATILADASGYTVAFDKDGVTYYRARFGGFESKDAAWNACNALKKKKIACYAVQQ